MTIKKVLYTADFKKKFKAISKKEKGKILKKLHLFWLNPLDTSLKTHKLSGRLKDHWSFSLNYKIRIMFRFVDKKTVELIDIGGHEIYK